MNERVKVNSDGTAELMGEATEFLAEIKKQAHDAVSELVDVAGMKSGQIFVVGCSTSEVTGNMIGKASVPEVAEELLEGISSVLAEREIFLAAQCCEHLNRVLIIERECAERYGLEPVCVRPVPKAGGAFATAAYENMSDPVAVESIRAHAGMDIGGTLIGMHLREVAVPVRPSTRMIGHADIICARTRPKYVGGPRAKYE